MNLWRGLRRPINHCNTERKIKGVKGGGSVNFGIISFDKLEDVILLFMIVPRFYSINKRGVSLNPRTLYCR